jgi:Domain of unknown function (DUF4331)
MKRTSWIAASLLAGAIAGATAHTGYASDHDDGETDIKSRALNLSDHYAFRSPSAPDQLSLIMYFNPRSLPGRQYYASSNARYEFHVSRAASRTAVPTAKDDFVFRFEFGAPDAAGVQPITLTVLKDGAAIGTHSGMTTAFAASKAGAITTNTGTIGSASVKYFVGPRADSFHFDVVRFFQVRTFLASRFFGGAGGNGDATASLADNCRGDKFLANLLPGGVAANEAGGVSDGDVINLFNPPSCAPDFTKNLNVTAIALNVPIAMLQANNETVFDTWSTISVPE